MSRLRCCAPCRWRKDRACCCRGRCSANEKRRPEAASRAAIRFLVGSGCPGSMLLDGGHVAAAVLVDRRIEAAALLRDGRPAIGAALLDGGVVAVARLQDAAE